MKRIITHSPTETMDLAKTIAQGLKPGRIICLIGDLGAGKTTFVKGLAKGLKISPKKVNSPTFVLLNIYEGPLPLYHFDFYRLEDAAEIHAIGYEEFLYGEGLSVIEWADRMGPFMPQDYLRIEIQHKSQTERAIRITEQGTKT